MKKKKNKKIWIASLTTFGLLGTAAVIGFPVAYLLPHNSNSNDKFTNLINQIAVTKTPLTFVPTNIVNGTSQSVSDSGLPPQNEFNISLPTGLSASDIISYEILPSSSSANISTQMQLVLTFNNNATKNFVISNLPSYANISLLFNTISAKIKPSINSNSPQWIQLLNLANSGSGTTINLNSSNTELLNSVFDFYFPAGLNLSFIRSFNLPSLSNNNYSLNLSSVFYSNLNNTLSQNISFSIAKNISQPINFAMSLAPNINISAPAINNIITNFSSPANPTPYAISDFTFSNLPSSITTNDMLGFTVINSNLISGKATINLYFNSQNGIFPFLNIIIQFASIQDYITNANSSTNGSVLTTGTLIPNVSLPSVSSSQIDVPNSMNFTFASNSILLTSDVVKYVVVSVDETNGSIVANLFLNNKNWGTTDFEMKNITITGYIDSFQQELNNVTVTAKVNTSENILSNNTQISGNDLNNYTFSFSTNGTASKLINQSDITSFNVISNNIISGSIVANISVKENSSSLVIYTIPNITITGFFQYNHYISNLTFYLINNDVNFPTSVNENIPINNILFQPSNNNGFFNNSNINSIAISSIDSANKTLQVLVTFQFKINNQTTYTTVQYSTALTFNWNTLS